MQVLISLEFSLSVPVPGQGKMQDFKVKCITFGVLLFMATCYIHPKISALYIL